jgi:hypothetical protein
MLNNITNFFNLIATKKVKTQLDATDLIAIGTKDPRFTGNYQPTLIEYANFVSGLVGGSNGQVLFNDNDTIAGAANSFWDNTNGRLGIGTNIPLGILHLKETAATTRMVMDGDAGQSKIITFRTNGLQRFGLYLNNIAESGGNAGSNLALRAYNDAGSLLSTPLYIHRASGNVGINTTTDAGFKLDVNGTARFIGRIDAGSFTPGAGASAYTIATTGRISAGNGISFRVPTVGDTLLTGFNSSFNDTRINTVISNATVFYFSGGGASTTPIAIATPNFNPSSGTGDKNIFQVEGSYNTSGTYSGIIRGFYYNPTLTSMAGVTAHYAWHSTSGRVRFQGLPTSPVGLSAGDVWNNLGILTIV